MKKLICEKIVSTWFQGRVFDALVIREWEGEDASGKIKSFFATFSDHHKNLLIFTSSEMLTAAANICYPTGKASMEHIDALRRKLDSGYVIYKFFMGGDDIARGRDLDNIHALLSGQHSYYSGLTEHDKGTLRDIMHTLLDVYLSRAKQDVLVLDTLLVVSSRAIAVVGTAGQAIAAPGPLLWKSFEYAQRSIPPLIRNLTQSITLRLSYPEASSQSSPSREPPSH